MKLSAFSTTMTNINTTINTTSTALQSFGQIATDVKSAAASGSAVVTGSGQTVGQQTALLQLKTMLEILNTQAGDRFLFSGSAIDTPSVASMDDILNGKGALAGLKQLIAERNQADLGASGLGRLVVSSPSPTSVSVAEDVAGSPFGFKLNAITSSLTGATVDRPERLAGGDVGRSRPHQSQQRRAGHLHVQPARRHDRDDKGGSLAMTHARGDFCGRSSRSSLMFGCAARSKPSVVERPEADLRRAVARVRRLERRQPPHPCGVEAGRDVLALVAEQPREPALAQRRIAVGRLDARRVQRA